MGNARRGCNMLGASVELSCRMLTTCTRGHGVVVLLTAVTDREKKAPVPGLLVSGIDQPLPW